MSVLVAVADSKEGKAALAAAITEARQLNTSLVVLNLALSALSLTDLPADVDVRTIERKGRDDRDPVEAVLDELRDDPAIQRLVIGVKRRTPVGKALLGSVSQRLLLEVDVPGARRQDLSDSAPDVALDVDEEGSPPVVSTLGPPDCRPAR